MKSNRIHQTNGAGDFKAVFLVNKTINIIIKKLETFIFISLRLHLTTTTCSCFNIKKKHLTTLKYVISMAIKDFFTGKLNLSQLGIVLILGPEYLMSSKKNQWISFQEVSINAYFTNSILVLNY